jgi:hypothetical protein
MLAINPIIPVIDASEQNDISLFCAVMHCPHHDAVSVVDCPKKWRKTPMVEFISL